MSTHDLFRQTATGIEFRVRLTPRASRDAIEGRGTGADGARHLAARVRAVPEKGKANAALEKLVAGWLDVPAGAVAVIAGGASRIKTVAVSGDAAALTQRAGAALDET